MQCVSDRDPLCGWCSVQNTCNRRSLCINSNLTYRWIDDDISQCTSVNGVSPDTASINNHTSVRTNICCKGDMPGTTSMAGVIPISSILMKKLPLSISSFGG